MFSAGNYKHIIFNLSLQEGWDDPACCLRLYRQIDGLFCSGRTGDRPRAAPARRAALSRSGLTPRPSSSASTTGRNFPKILKLVQDKLGAELPEVKVEGYTDPSDRQRSRQEPKASPTIPEIHIDARTQSRPCDRTRSPAPRLSQRHHSHGRQRGGRPRHRRRSAAASRPTFETLDTPHSNRVMARWIVRRGMQSLFPEVAKAIDWADPRFDARVEITSTAAAALRDAAERLVDAYVETATSCSRRKIPTRSAPSW